MKVYDVCAQIRADAKKTVANKGKKCPGGYWIPKKSKCGGKKLSSPEGIDDRREFRRDLRAGLGVGLGGAVLVGAASTAAGRGGKVEKTAGKKTGQEGGIGVSPSNRGKVEEAAGKKDSLRQGWVPVYWDENYVLLG